MELKVMSWAPGRTVPWGSQAHPTERGWSSPQLSEQSLNKPDQFHISSPSFINHTSSDIIQATLLLAFPPCPPPQHFCSLKYAFLRPVILKVRPPPPGRSPAWCRMITEDTKFPLKEFIAHISAKQAGAIKQTAMPMGICANQSTCAAQNQSLCLFFTPSVHYCDSAPNGKAVLKMFGK